MSPLPVRRHPLKPLFGKATKPAKKAAPKRETVKAEDKPAPAKKTAKKSTKKASK